MARTQGNKEQNKFLANPTQMYRIDSKGKFIEFLAPNEDFQKVTVNIVQYNNNNKKIAEDKYYFELPWFLELCRKIQSDSLWKKAEGLRQANQGGYGMEIITEQAGSVKTDGNGGKIITARRFSLEVAKMQGSVVFKIVTGPGRETKEGLIPLDMNRKNEFRTAIVPSSYQQLYEMAAICSARINAFIVYMQIVGNYTYKPENARGNAEPTTLPSPSYNGSPAPQVSNGKNTGNNPPAGYQQVDNGEFDYYGAMASEYTSAPDYPPTNAPANPSMIAPIREDINNPDIPDYGEGGYSDYMH